MSPISKRRLLQVHPELARRVYLMEAELENVGIEIGVTQGLRTVEEQNALYVQGRNGDTRPRVTNARGGYSNHNFGLAVDLVPIQKDGKAWWTAPKAVWLQIGLAAEREGLSWGGRWTDPVDMPHVELPGLSVARCRTLYVKGGLPEVWSELNSLRTSGKIV